MKLYELLHGLAYNADLEDIEIESFTSDSRQLEQGGVFVCIKGLRFDGHEYAARALEQGAAAIVVERDLGLPCQIVVQNTAQAYASICANFFGHPADSMKLIGVTGTNGKTTTTFIIKQILEAVGKKVGLIGTVQYEIGGVVIPSKYTTPDPYQLQTMLARMRDAGCEYVVMEVSSHAIDQNRVHGLHFACACFSNLTQDHLDYHHTMQEYFATKRRLFDMCDCAVINIDDEYGAQIYDYVGCERIACSTEDDSAQFIAKNIRNNVSGSTFALLHDGDLKRVRIPMPGMFSVYNSLLSIACCSALGIDLDEICSAIEGIHGVTGRFEVIPTPLDFTVIRDYAHTTDGIEKILTAVRELSPKRIVTLFGCAGCRDGSKRADMGQTAARLSDFVIITSDNPRSEDEQSIIDDAMPGILKTGKPYMVFTDRYEAIEWAMENAHPDDILMLLGKGHEDYQVLASGSINFNEREIVQRFAQEILAKREI